MKTEQDSCGRARRGELHLTTCNWDQYRQVGSSATDRYMLADGILVSPAGTVKADEHTQIIGVLCSFVGGV